MTITTADGWERPVGYAEFLDDLKRRVRRCQFRAVSAANTEVVRLYWSVGRDILDRQRNEGWGAKVVHQISTDMRTEFPGQKGWSRSSLMYMRQFAEAWPNETAIVQQPVGQLPWGHITVLLGKLRSREERDWYAARSVENGWSRASLEYEITRDLKSRLGSAPSNFTTALDAADSDLARHMVKDSYVFEHLDLDGMITERDREQALMDRIQATLMEFGRGMAFVGRQVRLDVGGDEFFIDLLLFHVRQLRYVVIELKVGKFHPAHVGQIGTYVAMVDGEVRDPAIHARTVGILLCTERNPMTLGYALAGTASPVAVSLYDGADPEDRASLPDPLELEAVIRRELRYSGAKGTSPGGAPDGLQGPLSRPPTVHA